MQGIMQGFRMIGSGLKLGWIFQWSHCVLAGGWR